MIKNKASTQIDLYSITRRLLRRDEEKEKKVVMAYFNATLYFVPSFSSSAMTLPRRHQTRRKRPIEASMRIQDCTLLGQASRKRRDPMSCILSKNQASSAQNANHVK
jgi:hypothetical protein